MKNSQPKPFNLILLGDVGAGKATQSAYFAKKYGMIDFDMGLELTLRRERDQKINAAQQRTADKGILTPTAIVRDILESKLKSTPADKGIIFDGHPKMIGEAKMLSKLLREQKRIEPLVIYLSLPHEETVKRIMSRKGYGEHPYQKRSDDTVTGLKNRARYYRDQISKVCEYFSKHYQFRKISGLGTKTEVRSRIQTAINEYLKNNEQLH